jgi:hypothetical protein
MQFELLKFFLSSRFTSTGCTTNRSTNCSVHILQEKGESP